MVNKILLDTSVLIDLQRGQPRTIQQLEKVQKNVALSRITACEFIYGSKNKQEKTINQEFINTLLIYEVTEEISKFTYKLLEKYGLKKKFDIADALIASTAIINDLCLWTLSTKHFSQIAPLKLFQPPQKN